MLMPLHLLPTTTRTITATGEALPMDDLGNSVLLGDVSENGK